MANGSLIENSNNFFIRSSVSLYYWLKSVLHTQDRFAQERFAQERFARTKAILFPS